MLEKGPPEGNENKTDRVEERHVIAYAIVHVTNVAYVNKTGVFICSNLLNGYPRSVQAIMAVAINAV